MMENSPMPSSAKEVGQPPPAVDDTPMQAVSGAERPILFRPNVAAILINKEGLLFIAERAHIRGSWQFPQGGVDPGEGLEEALFREVEEEIGVAPRLIQIQSRR